MAVHTAFQYAGLPPAAYPMAIKTLGYKSPPGWTRQNAGMLGGGVPIQGPPGAKARALMKRRQGLPGGKARAALRARNGAYGLTPVGSRRDLSRLRPLTEPAPPPLSGSEARST